MNVKPGDLAVIIASDTPENIGLFVDVLEADDRGKTGITLMHGGQVWICRAKGLITYRNILGQVCHLIEGPIPDDVLKPIRPPAPDTKVSRVRLHKTRRHLNPFASLIR
jgi:hypothetical protein